MIPGSDFLIAEDLAPGDHRVLEKDWASLHLHIIQSVTDPLFEKTYLRLWEEFGQRHEMESRSVIERRLQWHPAQRLRNCALLYQMMLLLADEKWVGIRDHTAIIYGDIPHVIVHLSHVLVVPEWRRSGVAAWLRALPLQTARQCAKESGISFSSTVPVTLVAEMEHWDESQPDRLIRLRAYEKAGYKKVDPVINYHQPDFRTSDQIEASGPQPLAMSLIIRRVGREGEEFIPLHELKHLIRALYEMYAIEFRIQDMQGLFKWLDQFQTSNETVRLLAPTDPGARALSS